METENYLNTPYKIVAFDALFSLEQALIHEAKKACKKSYSPYSNFRVGAALRLENGEIVHGANQENASYPVGICAERVALAACQSQFADLKITHAAVMAHKATHEAFVSISPCGICRQSLLEVELHQQQPIQIILPTNDEKFLVLESVSYLLPFQFDRSHL